MAVIATQRSEVEVQALGSAMDATVDLNGSLMEMLVTVYSYILMAAIREAIQNGTDAARRAGLTFAEGVQVSLPTASNLMFTVVDKGSGMTKEFMTTKYLAVGSSTKSADNGALGGLGIGRWASFGYIRESYITTCHASDMVERTYFIFQGTNGKPQVQLASEVPGESVGTRVSFPVKATDLAEALRAVAWLKEVMQLTMGDSFTVDNPAALPQVLPPFNGSVLTLDEFDSGLAGVRIYPMQGKNLKYARHGLVDGSLVVLTNKDAGVGGLPFHVQSASGDESVFRNGMVVEIPMSFNVPFMPSREELKNTDEVFALLRRIDEAAAKAVVAKAGELFSSSSLVAKGELSELLGNDTNDDWHWFARAARSRARPVSPLKESLSAVTGGREWSGAMPIPVVSELSVAGVTVKVTDRTDQVLRNAFPSSGYLAVSLGAKLGAESVTFPPNQPVALVVNDLKTGGTSRFRNWLRLVPAKGRRPQKFVYLSADAPADAQAAAAALNEVFGGVLTVHYTSTMPDVARVVVGSAVRAARTRGTTLTYFSLSERKQVSVPMGFATFDSREGRRVWLRKDGSSLAGFKDGVTLGALTDTWKDASLTHVMAALGIDRLYLLTTKQACEMGKMRAELQADGVWDMAEDEFEADEEGREALAAVKALKTWRNFEDVLAETMNRSDIQAILSGHKVHTVKENWYFKQFIEMLAKRPRMELTGTRFDKAVSPYIDLLTGTITVHKAESMSLKFKQLVGGLVLIGENLDGTAVKSTEREELIGNMRKLASAGYVDYDLVHEELRTQFPMLRVLSNLNGASDDSVDHVCQAFAAIYR